MQDYREIDIERLSHALANQALMEIVISTGAKYEDIYEEVDETGKGYLKEKFAEKFDQLKKNYFNLIELYEKD